MRPLLFATKPATPGLWAGMVLVLLTLVPTPTRADLIIGNLQAGDGNSLPINQNDYFAASFTMGSQDLLLSDVQVRLTGNPNDVTFQLRADASVLPASNALFTFDGVNDVERATKTYTFLAGSQFTLTANTTYWLVGFTTGSASSWNDSNPNTNPSGPWATFGQYVESSNSGASWSSSSDAPKFQVNGTAVPEPSSLVLAGAVACVAAAVGLRRQRTRCRARAIAPGSE